MVSQLVYAINAAGSREPMAHPDSSSFELIPKEHLYQDFEERQLRDHHWGRSFTEGDGLGTKLVDQFVDKGIVRKVPVFDFIPEPIISSVRKRLKTMASNGKS